MSQRSLKSPLKERSLASGDQRQLILERARMSPERLQYYQKMPESSPLAPVPRGNPQAEPCIFKLQRAGREDGGSLDLEVDFSPRSECPREVLPAFNNDGKYYTPSFILRMDEAELEKQEEDLRMGFLRKVEDSFEEKSSLVLECSTKMWPKPSGRRCGICMETFDDYFQHIQHPVHLARCDKAAYSSFLLELIDDFQAQLLKPDYRRSLPAVEGSSWDSSSQEHRPRKKRIVEAPKKESRSFCKEVASSTNCIPFQQKGTCRYASSKAG